MKPNEEGSQVAAYTSPALTIRSGEHVEHVMTSEAIARTLDSYFPTPPLHLEVSIFPEVEETNTKIFKALTPTFIATIPKKMLNPSCAEYFEKTRTQRFGMSPVEIERQRGGDAAWAAAKEPMDAMVELLRRDSRGPFFEGETRTYADFLFVTMLHFLKQVDETVFERFCAYDEVFPKIYDAYEPYFRRDDH